MAHTKNNTFPTRSEPDVKLIVAALVPASGDEDEPLVAAVCDAVVRAGAVVAGTCIQRRGVSRSRSSGGAQAMHCRAPLSATFIGTGKAAQLAALVQSTGANAVLFCNALTKTQRRNLERITGVRVVSTWHPQLPPF